ncbi:MAG: glycoside hydrolase family 38 C-terminal domain-containing protein [Verrucomicrobiales bacterium]|nr:glycoside hydrolase family 38 C-terminal domain-containing protein [Verrucomicrobiales bacterium]
MHIKHPELTLARASQFFARLCRKLLAETAPVRMDIAGPTDRIPRAEALRLNYRPAALGEELQPPWSTYWLKVRGEIPAAWRGKPVVFRFRSGSEALLWLNGEPYHGFNHEDSPVFLDGGRAEALLPEPVVHSGRFEAEVEIACQGLWGAPAAATSPTSPRYRLFEVQLALRDEAAWQLAHDLVIPLKWLEDLPELKSVEPWLGFTGPPPAAKKLPPWPGRVLQLLNHFCNVCDTEDRATWPAGRAVLRQILTHRNGTFAHQITAVGHAHIDTAWLWPMAEARRTCARTFSTALRLMERYPAFRFAAPAAQHYAWIQEHYPELYERIRAAVQRGQWVPVGGSWVEPDCNLPSGESLVRQFLFGQRFFQREFGQTCREFWNPDAFGWCGSLPQILRGVGIKFFLTHKLCWNQFNKPLHHTFYWEGIDGSRVLVHAPPADTYNALDFGNLIRHFHQHERCGADHDRLSEGLMLFGCGDGGGGPTEHMIEVIERLEDFQGFPRVRMGRPDEFFERLEAALAPEAAPVHVGELYAEFHRGTYTTRAANKRDNRRCERLLREVETLAAVNLWLNPSSRYPAAALNRVWQKVLLNQFHDILPGTSVSAVYEDSARDYAECLETLEELKTEMARAVVAGGKPEGWSLINTLGWRRAGVCDLPDGSLALVAAEPCGVSPLLPQQPAHGRCKAVRDGDTWVLANGRLQARFDAGGRLVSLRDLVADREVIAGTPGGNRFVLFEDYPHAWDAWEVDATHLEKRTDVPAQSARIAEVHPLRAALEFDYAFGNSRMTCRAILTADSSILEFCCDVDWCHPHRFLKVEFPVAVRAPDAAFEIPFGHVRRPTHFNSSQEMARFETPAHFWCDLSEEGYGVALLNDSKYGHAVHGNIMRLSLLRGSTSPAPSADQGRHGFRYGLYPHAGSLAAAEVVRRAHEFNTPWLVAPGTVPAARSWFRTDSPHLVLETVKKAEDSDALIVRLYECHGARGRARIETSLRFETVERVNLLEAEPIRIEAADSRTGVVPLPFRPFELITLKFSGR